MKIMKKMGVDFATIPTMKGLFVICVRLLLSLRYRIDVVGLEELKARLSGSKSGILFLANHAAEIDPPLVISLLWNPFKPHPVTMVDFFYKPVVRSLLQMVGALPVPTFDAHSNSYKKKQIEKTYSQIFSLLAKGENLLIYPSGGLKKQPEELIGGGSGIQTILSKMPECPVVLVKVTGLWGSRFSRALTGRSPDLFAAFLSSFKTLASNLIFFAPRRKLTVEFYVPSDFPSKASRLEINHYLEKWYNKEIEPLYLVSDRFWKKRMPEIKPKEMVVKLAEKAEGRESALEASVRPKILEELSRLSSRPVDQISDEMDLGSDLGLDSLDIAQMALLLKEEYAVIGLPLEALETVHDLIAFAAKEKKPEQIPQEERTFQAREQEKGRPEPAMADGATLMEAFLTSVGRMKGFTACGDQIQGFLSYGKIKRQMLVLREFVSRFPEEKIGVMLPASCMVNTLILALLFAKKVPVMINWTLGAKNLTAVRTQSGLVHTLSSFNFLNRLDNVDLSGVDDTFVLVEEMRFEIKPKDVLKGFFNSLLPKRMLLRRLGLDKMSGSEMAVLLYTSGTESTPKGVPLSHTNLLSDIRNGSTRVNLKPSDLLLGVLPPFHSFGFSVTGLFPLLAGLAVSYLPNPTDGRRIAQAIEEWQVTLISTAPTFLKNLLRVASAQQLRSLRIVVCGAEKMPPELEERLHALNPEAVLIEGYGITECGPVLTLNPQVGRKRGVGPPLPFVELKIVDPETKEPVSGDGLILARGPNIFSGYFEKSIPSPFIEIDGKVWYQTGDLGRVDEGYLVLTGRLKRFVKIGGEMISLGSIEETLIQGGKKKGWPLAEDRPCLAAVVREEPGKRAEIVLCSTFELSLEEANSLLKEEGLSNLSRVSKVRRISTIPLLGTGKIDYRTLLAKIEENPDHA